MSIQNHITTKPFLGKRFVATLIATIMMLTSGSFVAFAEDSHSGSTTVTATVGSSYTIIVPQAITLENEAGGNGSGTYKNTFNVTVKGDIGENQTVKVTATAPTMTCNGAADVAASFEAGYKTAWNRTEAAGDGTAAAYTVKAVDLTPGSWTGTATFNCELCKSGLISFAVDGVSYEAEDGVSWAQWCGSEYNTGGFYVAPLYIYNSDGKQIIGVQFQDPIIASFAYSTQSN